MIKKITTLCIVHDGKNILLGMKKRGFGRNRWNGFGGKVEEGEDIEKAALRELEEEAGIRARGINERGQLLFIFEDDTVDIEVSVFVVSEFDGEPKESDEMRPQWFAYGDIPYNNMWADDIYWLPHILSGKSIKGKFHFKDTDNMLEHHVDII